jgi:glutathione peroxidase
MVGKLHVKGPVQHPLYTWLTEKRYNQHSDSEVRWNFHKYLIDPQGRLVGVYPSHVEPDSPQITQRFES